MVNKSSVHIYYTDILSSYYVYSTELNDKMRKTNKQFFLQSKFVLLVFGIMFML